MCTATLLDNNVTWRWFFFCDRAYNEFVVFLIEFVQSIRAIGFSADYVCGKLNGGWGEGIDPQQIALDLLRKSINGYKQQPQNIDINSPVHFLNFKCHKTNT